MFRQDSAPKARELGPLRSCSKSTNSVLFGASSLGQREDEIHLFLSGNRIALLPNELFNLDALVVLSLRRSSFCEEFVFIDFLKIAHSFVRQQHAH